MIFIFEENPKLSWLITIIIAGMIFYLSSLSFKGTGASTGILSYVYHFFAFFFLALFLLFSLVQGKKQNLFLIAIIIAILYGISDEVHQYFVPNRYFAIHDVLLNSIGILSAGIIYFLFLKFRKSLQPKNFS